MVSVKNSGQQASLSDPEGYAEPLQDYVLYAEDNSNDATFFLRAFRREAPDVPIRYFSDGASVRDYLEQILNRKQPPPRLAIFDIKMPGLTGLELLAYVRGEQPIAHLPVVILSASYEERDVAEAHHHHVNSYLVKPNRYTELKKLVNSLTTFWLRFNTTSFEG